MAAVQVKRGKLSFLVGMDWELAQDKGDAKALLKQAGKKARIELKPSGEDRIWFGYAERAQRGLAGAAVVAEVLGDVIVAAPLEDGQVWLCATSQGMPIPTKDVVIDADHVRATLLEWMSYYPAASIFGDVNGSIGSAEEMWGRIESAIASGELGKRRLKQLHVIKPASGRDQLIVFAAFALFIGAAAGWHFFLRERPLSASELAKRRANGQAAQAAAAQRLGKEVPIYAHFDAVDKRYAFWKAELQKDALPWVAQVDALPVFSNGYSAAAGECQGGACTVRWQMRGPVPSMAARLKLTGFVVPQDAKSAQDAAPTSTFPLAPTTRANAVTAPGADTSIVAARWLLMDDLQSRIPGMSVTVDPYQPDTVPGVGASGVPAFEVGNTAPVKASFAGTGASIALKAYIRHLQKHPVVIDRLSFVQNAGTVNFDLQARYVTLNPPPKRPTAIEWDGEKAILK